MPLDECQQFLVGPFGVAQIQLGIGGAYFPQDLAHGGAHGALPGLGLFGAGRGIRYSMTVGSTPLLRSMASTLREVPQAGL